MGSYTLTTDATLMCPHGATVTVTATEASVRTGGAQPLKATDVFTVSGCQFKIPAGPAQIPSPCTTVVWVKPDVMVRAGGVPTLSTASIGLCIGLIGVQGTVQVSAAGQTQVRST